jgi:hypothetical protein
MFQEAYINCRTFKFKNKNENFALKKIYIKSH